MDTTADEADFLDLLIASERVEEWLDVVHAAKEPDSHLLSVLKEFCEHVSSKQAYAEEARNLGATSSLTKLLKRIGSTNEEAADIIADILAALSGDAAASGGVRDVQYPGGVSLRICEGALGDGVGARLWAVAHIVCRLLGRWPGVVKARTVLELGAGCGACGLAAAQLGAGRVVLTDYLPAVLRCLGTSVQLTFNINADKAAVTTGTSSSPCWEAGDVSVRRLDWTDDSAVLSGRHGLESAADGPVSTDTVQRHQPVSATHGDVPPTLDGTSPPFDVLLGTDILYEAWMAPAVAGVLAARLAAGGVALICCAVRDEAIFESFERAVVDKGLRMAKHAVQPHKHDVGVSGREWDYEGGFRLMVIDWQEAPWQAPPGFPE